jgi:hypothetical protein
MDLVAPHCIRPLNSPAAIESYAGRAKSRSTYKRRHGPHTGNWPWSQVDINRSFGARTEIMTRGKGAASCTEADGQRTSVRDISECRINERGVTMHIRKLLENDPNARLVTLKKLTKRREDGVFLYHWGHVHMPSIFHSNQPKRGPLFDMQQFPFLIGDATGRHTICVDVWDRACACASSSSSRHAVVSVSFTGRRFVGRRRTARYRTRKPTVATPAVAARWFADV